MERSTGEEPINEALKPCKIYPDIDRLTNDFAAKPMKICHCLPPPVRRGLSTPSNHPTPARRPGHKPDALLAPTAAKGDLDSSKASQLGGSKANNTPGATAGVHTARQGQGRGGNWENVSCSGSECHT